MKIRTLLLSFALIAASRSVHASSCAPKRYHIIISAFDGATQLGISGANVSLFANDEARAWLAEYGSVAPLVTDANGSVSGTFYFDTTSGGFLGMFGIGGCGRKLKHLEVVVAHEGYRPGRVSIKAAKAVTSSTPAEVTIRVPAIELRPLK